MPHHGRLLLLAEKAAEELGYRVIELGDDPFLQRDDGVVRDLDFLRADFGAAFRDVAEADVSLVLEIAETIGCVFRMHFETGGPYQESRTHEFVLAIVISQDVTDVLAEETLDALAKLLNPLDVFLVDDPLFAV